MTEKKSNNKVAICLIVILLLLVFLAVVLGLTSRRAYDRGYLKGKDQLTAYEKVIDDLQIKLNEADGYSEELMITIYTQQHELEEFKKANKNLEAEVTSLQQQLEKAKQDYLNSYLENYNKGYTDGYEYGLAVGRGELDTYIQNYIAENNGILQKSFKEIQVIDNRVEYRQFEDRDNIYTYSNVLNYVEDYSVYSLIVANAVGYETYSCTSLNTRLDERTRRVSSSGMSVIKETYTAYIHTFTFTNSKNETVEIVINYDPEFDNEASLVLGTGSFTVACNYFDITTTLSSLENGLTNFYIIQAQPEQ